MYTGFKQNGGTALALAFIKENDIAVSATELNEIIARLNGYESYQAMVHDVNFEAPLGISAESSHDFIMVADKDNPVWITVENISVHIKKCDEGVVVDLFSKGNEDEGCIASTYAHYNETVVD